MSRNAVELAAFDQYLQEVRGLSPVTRSARLRHVGTFLNDRFRSPDSAQLCAITPVEVAAFIERYTAGWAPGSIRTACGALRSYFAYRAVHGESTSALAVAAGVIARLFAATIFRYWARSVS